MPVADYWAVGCIGQAVIAHILTAREYRERLLLIEAARGVPRRPEWSRTSRL